MDLDAKLAEVGLARTSIVDAREVWLLLHDRLGPRATLIDRYELEGLVRGLRPDQLSRVERRELAHEVFRVRDPNFELVGDERGDDPIEVVPYRPAWPARFEEWRGRLSESLGEVAVRIEHVGSTAVVGLPAKPVIDVQVSVLDLRDEPSYAPAIEDLGVSLRARESNRAYFRPSLPRPRDVQVHVCSAGSRWERDHLLFRDYLRANEDGRDEYARLKSELADTYRDDRAGYNEGKAEFIIETMGMAEEWAAATGWTVGDRSSPISEP